MTHSTGLAAMLVWACIVWKRNDYLAFVMLFFAATSLAVSGSGSDVGMGEFWKKCSQIVLLSKLIQQLRPNWWHHSGDLQRGLAPDILFQLTWRQSRTLGKCLVSSPGLVRACILVGKKHDRSFYAPCVPFPFVHLVELLSKKTKKRMLHSVFKEVKELAMVDGPWLVPTGLGHVNTTKNFKLKQIAAWVNTQEEWLGL